MEKRGVFGILFFGMFLFGLGFFVSANPSCASSITSDTVLDGNMTCSGTALTIGADDISLDCNGYTITYSIGGTSNTRGVYALARDNVSVNNCTIIDGNFSGVANRYGIYFYRTNNSNITNNFVNTSNGHAIFVRTLYNNTLINNTAISDSGTGISLYVSANNNILTSNNGTSTSSYGIGLTTCDNNILSNNTGTSTSSRAIYLTSSNNNTLTNNMGMSSDDSGILLLSSDNNTLTLNLGGTNNTSPINAAGISLLQSNENNLTFNTGNAPLGASGIFVSGSSNNNFTSDTGNSSQRGIFVYGSSEYNIFTNSNAISTGSGRAFQIQSSDYNLVTGLNASSLGYGFYTYNATMNNLTNCVYLYGETYDIGCISDDVREESNQVINCSYGSEFISPGNISLIKKWYFDANVIYVNGTANEGVNLTMYNSSGIPVHSVLTNANGDIDRFEVVEQVDNDGNIIHATPHILKLSKSGLPFDTITYDFWSLQNVFDTVKYPLGFSITYPFSRMREIIQRDANFTIFGNVSGNIINYSNITSFTINYSGTASGTHTFTEFSNDSFNLSMPALLGGAYNFTIYDSNNSNVSFSINNVYVGDIILTIGQSNAVWYSNYPSVSYSPNWPITLAKPLSFSDNLVNITNTYRYAPLAYNISLNQDIPVMIMGFAVSATNIGSWQNATNDNYQYAVNYTRNYTRGTMNIKAIYWYQGESDVQNYNYSAYYESLSNLTNHSFSDFNIVSGKFVVGQILKTTSDTINPILVRKAQQDGWYNFNNVSRGPITYDIQIGAGEVHFDTATNKQEFSERIMKSILYAVYDVGENYPIVNAAYVINSTLIHVNFSKTGLEISNWNGTNTTSKAKGINLSSGVYYVDDAHVVSTSLSGTTLIVAFDQSISSMNNISICKGFSCYGQNVVRNSGNNLPMEIVYNLSLTTSGSYICGQQGKYWYSGSCHVSPQSSSTSSFGSGTGTYKPSKSSLENGFSANVVAGQKVRIIYRDDKTQEVEVKSVSQEKVVVSVGGIDYEINSSASGKIDLDNDGYYDIEISNNKVYSNGVANLEFKLINEKVSIEEKQKSIEKVVDNVSNVVKNIEWWVYVVVGVVIILIIVGIVLMKKRK